MPGWPEVASCGPSSRSVAALRSLPRLLPGVSNLPDAAEPRLTRGAGPADAASWQIATSPRSATRPVIARDSSDVRPRPAPRGGATTAPFAETFARLRRRALLVVLTELAEQAVAETLLPALPLVVRDHVVLVVAGARPRGGAMGSRDARRRPGATYRKAAAIAASTRAGTPSGGCAHSAPSSPARSPPSWPTPTCTSVPPRASEMRRSRWSTSNPR